MGLLQKMLCLPSQALLLLWLLSVASLLHHYPCSGSPLFGEPQSSAGLSKPSDDSALAAAIPPNLRSWLPRAMNGHARKLGSEKLPKLSSSAGSLAGNGTVINVMDFGAKGDGLTDDSKPFADAWAKACSSAVAVELLVPGDKTFLLPPATFLGPCKSDVKFVIKGTILASPNRSDWDKKDIKRWITFDTIKNLKIEGSGTIDGNGPIWWNNSCKVNKALRCTDAPTAVTFRLCPNLHVDGIRFKDAQKMHVTFLRCTDVKVSNVFISAPADSPNTDGIHITSTTNIQIYNSIIQTGDDCVSIVKGSQFVNITNIRCGPGHGISIGSLGENGALDTVSNVLVDTAQIEGTTNGVRIKTWQGGKGHAKDIVFKNIFMKNVKNPIIIDQNYCDSAKKCPGVQKSAVAISGVAYKNITGTSVTSVVAELDCSKSVPCRNIVLEDINLATVGGSPAKSICNNVNITKSGTVIPDVCSI